MGVDFSGVSLPFNVNDLFSSSMALMGLFGSFILLALAIRFTPYIIHLVRETIAGYHYYNSYDDYDWYGGKKPSKGNILRKSFRKAKEYY